MRHDGGDAETGARVELGGGVSYADRPRASLIIVTLNRKIPYHRWITTHRFIGLFFIKVGSDQGIVAQDFASRRVGGYHESRDCSGKGTHVPCARSHRHKMFPARRSPVISNCRDSRYNPVLSVAALAILLSSAAWANSDLETSVTAEQQPNAVESQASREQSVANPPRDAVFYPGIVWFGHGTPPSSGSGNLQAFMNSTKPTCPFNDPNLSECLDAIIPPPDWDDVLKSAPDWEDALKSESLPSFFELRSFQSSQQIRP